MMIKLKTASSTGTDANGYSGQSAGARLDQLQQPDGSSSTDRFIDGLQGAGEAGPLLRRSDKCVLVRALEENKRYIAHR
jgi:hypothetical protein